VGGGKVCASKEYDDPGGENGNWPGTERRDGDLRQKKGGCDVWAGLTNQGKASRRELGRNMEKKSVLGGRDRRIGIGEVSVSKIGK